MDIEITTQRKTRKTTQAELSLKNIAQIAKNVLFIKKPNSLNFLKESDNGKKRKKPSD